MTYVAVGDQPTGISGKGNGGGGETLAPKARASRPRAREGTIITRTWAVTQRARDRVSAAGDKVGDAVEAGPPVPLWSSGAATPEQVFARVREGGWAPDEAPWLERAGKVYGYVIAVPATVVLHGVAWLLQRPSRAALALVAALVVVLTWLPLTASSEPTNPAAPVAAVEVQH